MSTCHRLPLRKTIKWTLDYYRRGFHIFPRLYARGKTDSDDCCDPLKALVVQRRCEARRSLLVEVASVESAKDLHHVCSCYGSVSRMFHYPTRRSREQKEMILVEFTEESSLRRALTDSGILTSSPVLPACAPLVWLAAEKDADDYNKTSINSVTTTNSNKSDENRDSNTNNNDWDGRGGSEEQRLSSQDSDILTEHSVNRNKRRSASGHEPLQNTGDILELSDSCTMEDLGARLFQCKDMSQQIQMLYDSQKLSELGWRLRFFSCWQIESALSGLFPRATVLPFGSSINFFGNSNCDLDMNLEFGSQDPQSVSPRLIFQAKKSSGQAASRGVLQRHMQVISDILHCFMPGCSQVLKILNAKVPIIKYRHDLTDLECDLSVGNSSGYHMSQLLYLYGECDVRVRPMVLAVRRWARDHQLTSSVSGRWITNFPLTLLVLFYLMNVSPRVILPLNDLGITTHSPINEPESARFIFPFTLSQLPSSENQDSLENLLREFFHFYDTFNFKERGLSLTTGGTFFKPDHGALYIQNPLSTHLNVSRNVPLEEVERIRNELRNARYLLEGCMEAGSVDGRAESWGALCLWSSQQKCGQTYADNKYHVNWSDLFIQDVTKTNNAWELAGNAQKKGSMKDRNSQNSTSTTGDNLKKMGTTARVQKTGSLMKNAALERQQMQWEDRKRFTDASELNGLVTSLKQQALKKKFKQKKNHKRTQSTKSKFRY